MEAMILAAGLGTRLGTLTRDTPKALIPVAGVPMLERVARRLIEAGVDRLIVNVHHHAEQIADFLHEREGFGVEYVISREIDRPLDTGGGLQHAAGLFRADAPFFVHNADILSRIPLRALYQSHLANTDDPLATLVVMARDSARSLLFDQVGLIGRADDSKSLRLEVRAPVGAVWALPYGGVHVVSPAVFSRMSPGVYSIFDVYLEAVAAGAVVAPYEVSAEGWVDIGRPEQLARADRSLWEQEQEQER
jgi:NDP-sugar pyrophosphorylase family protein